MRKKESTNAVTVTFGCSQYSEVEKPVDCLNCTRRIVIAKSSPYLHLLIDFYYSSNANLLSISTGMKANSFHINRCVTTCSYFVASAKANIENGVPLRKWHCLNDSEFVIFRNVMNEVSVPDSYRAWSRPRAVFLFLFFPRKKEKGQVLKLKSENIMKIIKCVSSRLGLEKKKMKKRASSYSS